MVQVAVEDMGVTKVGTVVDLAVDVKVDRPATPAVDTVTCLVRRPASPFYLP